MREETYQIFLEYIRTALGSKDRVSARKAAQYIVEKFPGESEAWLLLAGLSDPEESLGYIRRAKEIAPDDPRVHEAEAWAKKRIEKASQEKAIQEESIQFFLDYINNCLRDNDISSANKAANFLIERYPEKVEGWLSRGWLSSLEVFVKAKDFIPNEIRINDAESLVIDELSRVQPIQPEKEIVAPIIADEITPDLIPISEPVVRENRSLIWLWALLIIVICAAIFFGLSLMPTSVDFWMPYRAIQSSELQVKPMLTQSGEFDLVAETEGDADDDDFEMRTQIPTSEPSPTPSMIPDLYGCEMSITFVSGPLIGQGTDLTMLDETYFEDKADKFEPGKNTGIYYADQAYVILHSGFYMGNRNSPLEIEFLRSYLELWGDEDTQYIENQIQGLIGSEMVWRCKDGDVYRLRVRDVVRLSHQASDRLWLEPENILQIVENRGGRADEWIGGLPKTDEDSLLLGFCGWGPPGVQVDRSVYYRYVIDLEVLD